MTRQESWEVDGTTLRLLRQITACGFVVSVFRLTSSLMNTRPAAVEMHVLDLSTEPATQHIARVCVGEAGDIEYRCAVLLAELVGIDLADG